MKASHSLDATDSLDVTDTADTVVAKTIRANVNFCGIGGIAAVRIPGTCTCVGSG